MQTSLYTLKRKALGDLTNYSNDEDIPMKTDHNCSNAAVEMMPNITQTHHSTSVIPSDECERFQNVHSLLGWYKHDLRTFFFCLVMISVM